MNRKNRVTVFKNTNILVPVTRFSYFKMTAPGSFTRPPPTWRSPWRGSAVKGKTLALRPQFGEPMTLVLR